MHPLRTLLAIALLAAAPGFAASEDWETIGLRISPREVVTPEGPRVLPYVVAVREQSPAFFAGVQPGDAVSFLRCGNWTWNFIDNLRNGTTYYRTHESVGATDAGMLDRRATARDACSRTDLGGLISVSRLEGQARIRQFMEFRTASATAGRWLTSQATVVSAAASARSAQMSSLSELRARAATELRVSPCSYPVENAHDIPSMPPLIQEIVNAARAAGMQEDVLFWRDVMWGYCSDEKNGPLPSFETAVYLMSTGHLKPCDYDPNVDYRFTLDYDKRQRPISWNEYDRMKDLDYMFGRNDTTQHECFFKAVRGALGKS